MRSLTRTLVFKTFFRIERTCLKLRFPKCINRSPTSSIQLGIQASQTWKIRACDHMLENKHQSEASFTRQINLTPMEPLNYNGSVDFTNSINCFCCIQESASATSSCFCLLNCLQNIYQSQPILEDLKALNNKNEMVDFSNQVDVPLDSTNQLVEFMDWSNNQVGDFEGWINTY